MAYCSYYQATIARRESLYFVALLHSYDHLSFDRTFDVENSIFEFFVPESTESYFLEVMAELEKAGYVSDLKKMENRLAQEGSSIWAS